MNKVFTMIPVMFAIFTLMMSQSLSSVYADQPSTSPNACQESNPGKSKAVGNKHCDDAQDIDIQFTSCDLDKSGSIDPQELVELGHFGTTEDALQVIDVIEGQAGSKSQDLNQTIDTELELDLLNSALVFPCE